MILAPRTRRSPALLADGRSLELRRRIVRTRRGSVVVRTGRPANGPATIMLHGAAGSWTTWTPLIAQADRDGSDWTDLVVVDLPGWGESGTLPRSMTVADVSAAVMDTALALGYTSWHLVGHSLGGFVALDIAAREPLHSLSVTLVSPTGSAVIDAVRHPLRGGAALPAFAGMRAAMGLLDALGPAGAGLLRVLDRAGAMPALAAPLFARPRSIHSSVIDALAREIRPRSFGCAARLAASYDMERWSEIVCPVLSIRGRRDAFCGPRDRDGFAAHIARFRETVLDDAGHFAHIERADAVGACVDEARAVGSRLRAAARS